MGLGLACSYDATQRRLVRSRAWVRVSGLLVRCNSKMVTLTLTTDPNPDPNQEPTTLLNTTTLEADAWLQLNGGPSPSP